MSIRTAVCSLLPLILCACSAATSTVPSAVASGIPASISATAESTREMPTSTATPTPEPTPGPVERPLYQIRAALDTRASEANGWTMALAVQEQVTYTNRSTEALNE